MRFRTDDPTGIQYTKSGNLGTLVIGNTELYELIEPIVIDEFNENNLPLFNPQKSELTRSNVLSLNELISKCIHTLSSDSKYELVDDNGVSKFRLIPGSLLDIVYPFSDQFTSSVNLFSRSKIDYTLSDDQVDEAATEPYRLGTQEIFTNIIYEFNRDLSFTNNSDSGVSPVYVPISDLLYTCKFLRYSKQGTLLGYGIESNRFPSNGLVDIRDINEIELRKIDYIYLRYLPSNQ